MTKFFGNKVTISFQNIGNSYRKLEKNILHV